MKYIVIILLLLLCLLSPAYAQYTHFSSALPLIEEEDGSPSVRFRKLKVSNGLLTDNRDGTASLSISLLPPIIEWYDPVSEGGLPVDPEIGDRYGADSTGYGWTIDYIYEWDGSEWIETTPEEGWMVMDLFFDILWFFFSGGWEEVGYDSYWSLWYDQYGIEGDKSGSFNLTTTGDGGFDNVTLSGDLTVGGDIVATGNIRRGMVWHAYGGFQDQNETLSINSATWTHVTNAGNNLWTGLEADGLTLVNDEMVIANTGDYVGVLSITFEGDNTKDYLFRISNVTAGEPGTATGYHIGATGLGANNYANASIPLYIEATAGDQFQAQVYQASGSDAKFLNAIFNLTYIHD